MFCKELKVVNLNITEDHYEYKALFRLCSEEYCMDIDLSELSEESLLQKVKDTFKLEESLEEIKEYIMNKVMDASKIESRINEGEQCCNESMDEQTQRDIHSLSRS